jgi:hypothetical protein
MQQCVDRRPGTGGRDDVTVIHVEGIVLHIHRREFLPQAFGIHPVGRAVSAVEKTGVGEQEGPAAQGNDGRTVRTGMLQRCAFGLGAAGGKGRAHDHQVRFDQRIEPMGRGDAHGSRVFGDEGAWTSLRADPVVELRDPGVAAIDPEDLGGDAELEQ